MDGKVQQFISITGTSVAEARGMLEACGGDLQLAVGMYLESGGGGATGPEGAGPSSGGAENLTERSYEEIHGVRAPIPQTRGVLIEEEAPTTRVLRSRRLPQTVFDPFQDFRDHIPGLGDSEKKKSLAELFRPPQDLLFHGSFQQAREAGQCGGKWLLVNLQDSHEFSCQVLNRDVWSNDNVKEMIRHHFLFLQLYRITDEGLKFKQLYQVDSFPHIAIIDPRTGEKMLSWSIIGAADFLVAAKEFLDNNPLEDEMDAATDGQARTVVEQSEESQIEEAIRASLQAMQPTNSVIVFSSDDEDGAAEGTGESDLAWTGSDISDMDADVAESGHGGTSAQTSRTSTSHTGDSTAGRPAERSTLPGERDNGGSGRTANTSPKLDADVQLKPCTVDIHPLNPSTIARGRKRQSTGSSDDDLPRKALRVHSPADGRHTAPQTNHVLSQGATGRESPAAPSRGKKQAGGRKGKGRAKGRAADAPTVEEQLASGAIRREDVAQVVVRLPEGDRVQKAFLCQHPIQELYDYLQSKGIDLTEHEVVTQFPRRSVSSLSSSTSFKDADLYPRETVFVHPVD